MSDGRKWAKGNATEGDDGWGGLPGDVLEIVFGIWMGVGQVPCRMTTIRLVSKHWKAVADGLVKALRPALGASMGDVGVLLNEIPNVQTLDLSGWALSDEEAVGLAQCLKGRGTLLEIDMSGIGLSKVTWPWLVQALGGCPNLTSLDVSSCQLGDAGIEVLSDVLKTHASLTALNVSSSGVSNLEAQYLMEGIKKSSAPLRALKLGHNRMTWECMEDMGAALDSCKSTLEAVDVTFNHDLMCIGLVHLFNGLAGCHRLEKLNFGGCSGIDAPIKVLADLINRFPRLVELRMGHNRISDDGGHHAGRIIEHAARLTLLDISHNPLGEHGSNAILESLARNTGALKTLICKFCYGMEWATKWDEGLRLSKVETLVVGYDQAMAPGFFEQGVDMLATGFQSAEALTAVEINVPHPTGQLSRGLASIQNLKTLKLAIMNEVSCLFLVELGKLPTVEELSIEVEKIEGDVTLSASEMVALRRELSIRSFRLLIGSVKGMGARTLLSFAMLSQKLTWLATSFVDWELISIGQPECKIKALCCELEPRQLQSLWAHLECDAHLEELTIGQRRRIPFVEEDFIDLSVLLRREGGFPLKRIRLCWLHGVSQPALDMLKGFVRVGLLEEVQLVDDAIPPCPW